MYFYKIFGSKIRLSLGSLSKASLIENYVVTVKGIIFKGVFLKSENYHKHWYVTVPFKMK